MSKRTDGQWWDKSYNAITGCTPVSAGCAHCWAHVMAKRFKVLHGSEDFSRVRFHANRLNQPLRWRRPQRVFACGMTDICHPDVDPQWVRWIGERILDCPRHTFIMLTKRADRLPVVCGNLMRAYGRTSERPVPNLWPGISAEDQPNLDARLPHLLATPAAKRVLSLEPLLGPIDITKVHVDEHTTTNGFYGGPTWLGSPETGPHGVAFKKRLHWVIVGGETGRGARPMEADWARSIRDQCIAIGVPFWLKNLGLGKGRILDGKTYEEFPE